MLHSTTLDSLELVAAFLNSSATDRNLEWHETFTDTRSVSDWIRAMQLPGAGQRVVSADVGWLREARERLRDWLSDRTAPSADLLADASRECTIVIDFTSETAFASPSVRGVRATFGFVVSKLAGAEAVGALKRLKVCRNDACRWVFVDRTRSCTRVWCSMQRCGDVAKARAYRVRKSNEERVRTSGSERQLDRARHSRARDRN